jgi:NAD+ synthase (glutamine-hydrolysing)
MTTTLRIALAQMNPKVGDLLGNTNKIIEYIDQARAAAAELITFPELTITGYPPEDLVFLPAFVEDNLRCLQKIAIHAQGVAAIVGFVDRAGGSLFNGAALLANGAVAGVYHKICLPNYGVFDEKRYFEPGREIFVADICSRQNAPALRFAINICEDIWAHAGVSEFAAAQGAQVIVNISASPYEIRKPAQREALLRALATRTNAHVLYVNLLGGQDDLLFDGQAFVVEAGGRLLFRSEQFSEKLFINDMTIDTSLPRPAQGVWAYGVKNVVIELPEKTEKPPVPVPEISPYLDDEQTVFEALVLGTRDYVRKNGFNKVLLGLSGGIDSALTAAVAARALGPENVVGVLMPSQFTAKDSNDDALVLARNLRIKTITLPIEETIAAFEKTLAPVFESRPRDITEENLQARARGMLLMALSNKFNWLLLSTGNKSEYATGYCTLYGDMAGAFAVLKDVSKTMVYRLSHWVNRQQEIIPRNTIVRPPTAELRPNQRDQDTLPPYDLLDRMIAAHVENNRGFDDMTCELALAEPKVASEFLRMVTRSEFKRRQGPPGIKITSRAFGRERRIPITNGYNPNSAILILDKH